MALPFPPSEDGSLEGEVMEHRTKQSLTRSAVACLILAPTLLLGSALAAPQLKTESAAELSVISAHPDRWYWYAVLILAGSVLLVPALVALASLVLPRSPRLALVGGGFALVGSLIAIADAGNELVVSRMVGPGTDRTQMAGVLDRYQNDAATSVIFTIGGLTILIGVALLAIGLYRSPAVPSWVAAAVPIGAVLNVVGLSGGNTPVVIGSCLILLAGLGRIAVALPSAEASAPAVDARPAFPASTATRASAAH
jgi:hypothetical protein